MSEDRPVFNPDRDLESIPREAGVYLMHGLDGKVIYVGKASSLRSRLSSYFRGHDPRPFVARLAEELGSVETLVTRNPKEALILENILIKKHRPRYNVRLKDDRNYIYVRISRAHAWPRLETVRRRSRGAFDFVGPFTDGSSVRKLVLFLSAKLGLRVCSDNVFGNRVRPCLQHQMKRCPAPCCLEVDPNSYRKALALSAKMLKGKNSGLEAELKGLMQEASAGLRFEEAGRYRDLVKTLAESRTPQSIIGPRELNADAACWYEQDEILAIGLVHTVEGAVDEVFSAVFHGPGLDRESDFLSFLLQFYEHRSPAPELILESSVSDADALAEALAEAHGTRPVITQNPGAARRALLDLAEKNAKVAVERHLASRAHKLEALAQLRTVLGLPEDLRRIECFDVSQLSGTDAAASMSVAVDGELQPSEYRVFHIKGAVKDDYSMMAESLRRHLAHMGTEPVLVLLDGGRAHLSMLAPIFEGRRDVVFLAAIAKARPEQGLLEDRIYLPEARREVTIDKAGGGFRLLTRLRDEAHRFGLKHHRLRRKKRTLVQPDGK